MGVCENYILTHMTLKSVFSHLEISQELGYDKISRQAQQLICANLGRFQIETWSLTPVGLEGGGGLELLTQVFLLYPMPKWFTKGM